MKTNLRWLLLTVATCGLAAPSVFAQKPNSAANAPTGPLTFDSFKLVHTRNVFDPDRRPPRNTTTTPTVSSGRADYVALTGTVTDPNKNFALFSGSRTDFNKVLTVGDKIANSTITQITSLNIVVDRDGKRTTVAVGQTVPLDAKAVPGAAPVNFADAVNAPAGDGSAPQPATTATAGTTSSAAVGGSAAPAGSPAPGGKGASTSPEEIMRRMMERRKQELK